MVNVRNLDKLRDDVLTGNLAGKKNLIEFSFLVERKQKAKRKGMYDLCLKESDMKTSTGMLGVVLVSERRVTKVSVWKGHNCELVKMIQRKVDVP